MLQSLQKGHFRPRKAAEVTVPPPTAPRPPHTLCGHRRRRDTSPRGSAERSAPPPALRRAPRSGLSLGEFLAVLYRISWYVFGAAERPRGVLASPQHPVQHIVVRFRRPKHLFHMLRGGTRLGPEVLTSARRAATGAQSTNPATVPPPAKLFCSVRTINLESAAERARSFGVDTHFSGASGAARLSSAAPRAVLGPQVLWRGPRSGRGVFWRVQHLVQHPTPKALLSSAP